MSTKALEEALDYLEHNPTADEAQDARRRARKELEAIRKVAKAIAECRPTPYGATSVHGKKWYPAMNYMITIAKEAE